MIKKENKTKQKQKISKRKILQEKKKQTKTNEKICFLQMPYKLFREKKNTAKQKTYVN